MVMTVVRLHPRSPGLKTVSVGNLIFGPFFCILAHDLEPLLLILFLIHGPGPRSARSLESLGDEDESSQPGAGRHVLWSSLDLGS